jgi:hypothetical protein
MHLVEEAYQLVLKVHTKLVYKDNKKNFVKGRDSYGSRGDSSTQMVENAHDDKTKKTDKISTPRIG